MSMMEITMARGDLETRTFRVNGPDRSPFLNAFDNIYMTVKKFAEDKKYIFQKRLSDGGIMQVDDGVYQFTIMPDDTDGLAFGDYDFDIELVINGELKKTYLGVLHLTKEVTHHSNEVVIE